MGQYQTKKLLGEYGQTDFSKALYQLGKDASGKGIVGISVEGLESGVGSKVAVTLANDTIKNTVAQFSQFVGQQSSTAGLKYASQYDMILDKGKFFKAQVCPTGVQKGIIHECYRNASMLALENSEYTYVEGFAIVKEMPGYPIAHAWVVDRRGFVVDSTWDTPGSAYFGIPFKTDYVLETMNKTKVWGIIPEAPTKKFNPFKDGFKEGAIYE